MRKVRLTDVGANISRRDTHLFTQFPGRQIVDEFSTHFGIVLRMFTTGTGEHHERRAARHSVEKAVRREIHDAAWTYSRDPSDRTRHHQCGQRIVFERVFLVAWIEVHAGFSWQSSRAN